MDGYAHPLTLKVMRVSRPSLASAWQPFFSSSPSFSAHSTATVISLQGTAPLIGHPKTLRDLSHASEMLTLPSSFGSIQLGETFSSCLCINNEAAVDIEGVSMKVEIQTATNKTVLTEIGGNEHRLVVGDTLETVVHHEMKELGQHVLACIVSYRVPPGARQVVPNDDSNDPSIQTFRKFYKFAVTNPLSVKTKVHIPRSPTAQLSKSERNKIFLEVHIQNLTQESMWFERMRFEALDSWQVEDGNVIDEKSVFSGATALMQPQDMRQYIYILVPTPALLRSFPQPQAPGTIIPLGRLDISWRSSFGEPGRLLTSVLSRRIPLTPSPPPPAASALPPYLQKAAGSGVPRPHSPQLAQQSQRTGTPPGSPAPYKRVSAPASRPQSPGPAPTPNPLASASAVNVGIRADLEVDLVVKRLPYDEIHIEQPFLITFALTASATLPLATALPSEGQKRRERVISLVVQHVQQHRTLQTHKQVFPTTGAPPALALPGESFSPQVPSSGFSSPSPTATPWRGGNFNHSLTERLLLASPRQSLEDHDHDHGRPDAEEMRGARLPAPFASSAFVGDQSADRSVIYAGSSALYLLPIKLSRPQGADANTAQDEVSAGTLRAEATREFTLSYVPLQKGFAKIGGLRILVSVDMEVEIDGAEDGIDTGDLKYASEILSEARILKEWDVIGEVWVK